MTLSSSKRSIYYAHVQLLITATLPNSFTEDSKLSFHFTVVYSPCKYTIKSLQKISRFAMHRLMLFLINKYLLLLLSKYYFLWIFLLHFFTFLLVSSILSVKWHVASLICFHNSASGIMFRIKKVKICTRLTTKNLETDSAFHIWFLNTSGKNHPAFLEKLLGNTCLTYRTVQLNIGSFQGESFGQKLPSTQQHGFSVQHFPVQEPFYRVIWIHQKVHIF